MHPLSSLYSFLTETAYLAGRLTLGYFQTGLAAEYKADHTPVTLADRRSEELIRQRIEARFPDHAIVGEEFGLKETEGATHRWFIDPIDGTKAFTHGVPLYSVLIGLEIEGRMCAGAVYFPALDEMISAADGLGCWWNGRQARVSTVSQMEEAVVCFTDPRGFARRGRGEAWQRLMEATFFQSGWSDAYGYALVATGRAEIAIDPAMHEWDNGPFPPIFREAGGYFGDWLGEETIYHWEALATNRALLPAVLQTLAGEPA